MPGIQSLTRVDTSAAAGEFAKLVPFFHCSRWDHPQTPFAESPLEAVEDYRKSARTPQSKRDVKCYIAVSGPLHCADGWSYLGRAVDAHNRGDVPTSVHLGYYASLRAAMSFLATQSIGVFNNTHIYIDQASGDPEIIRGLGTHKFVWEALGCFLTSHKHSRFTLEEIVRPGGHSLRAWLNEANLPSAAGGAEIVRTWGLDLQRLSCDRQTRNHVSYRPIQYSGDYRSGTEACARFMSELWGLSEPAGSSFWSLDRYLLRQILELEFEGTQGQSVEQGRSRFESFVYRAVNQLAPTGADQDQWLSFLLRDSDPTDPEVFDLAKKKDPVGKSGQHLQVLSRSFLLLRLASGACARFLGVSGVSMQDLEFWWSEWGSHMGLWESGQFIPSFADLWLDVEIAMDDLENGSAGTSGSQPSRKNWLLSNAESLAILGSCERIALWGLGL